MTAPQPCSLCARPEADHDDAACPFGWTPAVGPVVLCCGSRDWQDRATVLAWLQRFPPGTVVIHGAARGADTIAGEVAAELGFAVRAYPARWDSEGKAAGPLRNQRMLDSEPDILRVLAFTASIMRDGRLSGTGDMLRRCVEAGVVATVVPPGGSRASADRDRQRRSV
jgi:hypothetical protein